MKCLFDGYEHGMPGGYQLQVCIVNNVAVEVGGRKHLSLARLDNPGSGQEAPPYGRRQTLLEMAPASDVIRRAGEVAFADWAAIFSQALEAEQVLPEQAKRLASMAIAVIEGALIQARVAVQQKPLLDAAEEIATAFDVAIKDARKATYGE